MKTFVKDYYPENESELTIIIMFNMKFISLSIDNQSTSNRKHFQFLFLFFRFVVHDIRRQAEQNRSLKSFRVY
jgi:hypothetical protein